MTATASVEARDGNGSAVQLSGELDLASAPLVARELERLAGDVHIDCRGLLFLDCSGIRVLVDAHRRLGRAGAQLFLHRVTGEPLRILEILDLAELLHVNERTVSGAA